jgi:hypothetical protein
MKNKQTAVELLEEKMFYFYGAKRMEPIIRWIEHAKAMEKEQMKDAYEYGFWLGNNDDDLDFEQYYENNYEKTY